MNSGLELRGRERSPLDVAERNQRRHPGTKGMKIALVTLFMLLSTTASATFAQDELTAEQIHAIREAERARVLAIQKVYHSVVAVYGDDQSGGGSGVVIDPSGLALTNHHVIQGAGVSGFGGLADGKLYPWKLIGTDPGGDVAIIQLEGKDEFPYATLADSDTVRVGDWALAMGNPFILAEDQTPTVTLGIVSGVKRYQYGSGNELVYGNCIQTDSSINPGNSGGPLFNIRAQIIGINGRGSFQDRGRVNVGLGYAISSNQIRNFIPDLLATKLVEHGTLDAQFGDRSGGVICESINTHSPAAKLGLELGDRLIAFEGFPITSANQFTNLICTLPENWPAELTIVKQNGDEKTIWVRMYGLPYTPPPPPQPQEPGPDDEEPTPEQQEAIEKQQALQRLLASPAGTILDLDLNRANLMRIVDRWSQTVWTSDSEQSHAWQIRDAIRRNGQVIGSQEIVIDRQGRFQLTVEYNGVTKIYGYDGSIVWIENDGERNEMRKTSVAGDQFLAQLMPLATLVGELPFDYFGLAQLDGGDKAQRQTSMRIKTLDDGGNWFYVWVSMPTGYDLTEIELLKASVDIDGGEGAVTFHDWADSQGLKWPQTRRFVDGLGETETEVIETESIERIEDFDADLFLSQLSLEAESVTSEGESLERVDTDQ